jgi:molybdopterin-guanine dinucleotide biosynthesis protein A
MGRDKALLAKSGKTLLEHASRAVREAVGDAVIIADPSRYAHLGLSIVADRRPGFGPLGGIATALEITAYEWNLIVAVDMPGVSVATLRWLVEQALESPSDCECIAPMGPTGPEPLCAVYRRPASEKINDALNRNILKMRTVLQILNTRTLTPPFPFEFDNINTPEDWAAHE